MHFEWPSLEPEQYATRPHLDDVEPRLEVAARAPRDPFLALVGHGTRRESDLGHRRPSRAVGLPVDMRRFARHRRVQP